MDLKWRIEDMHSFIDAIHCQDDLQREHFFCWAKPQYSLLGIPQSRGYYLASSRTDASRAPILEPFFCPKCNEPVPDHILLQMKLLGAGNE